MTKIGMGDRREHTHTSSSYNPIPLKCDSPRARSRVHIMPTSRVNIHHGKSSTVSPKAAAVQSDFTSANEWIWHTQMVRTLLQTLCSGALVFGLPSRLFEGMMLGAELTKTAGTHREAYTTRGFYCIIILRLSVSGHLNTCASTQRNTDHRTLCYSGQLQTTALAGADIELIIRKPRVPIDFPRIVPPVRGSRRPTLSASENPKIG